MCSIDVQGGPAGLSKAQVACSSGGIIASADDPEHLKLFQGAGSSNGVTWVTGSRCGLEANTCVLAICGVSGGDSSNSSSKAVNISLTVNNITNLNSELWGVVCIAGDTKALLQVMTDMGPVALH